nr:hypothetical protein [Bradyrhizobium sediminis]
MAAIGRDIDMLAGIGADEHQHIEACLALDDIAAVTRIPDEQVITATEQRHVVAAATRDGIVAIAADQPVAAVTAGDPVVACTAIDRPAGERRQSVTGDNDVIAAAGADRDVLDAIDVHRDIADILRQQHALAIGRDRNDLVGARAVEGERIDTSLALDDVAAVSGIPGIPVVAGAEQRHVVARSTGDDVIAIAALDEVAAAAGLDRIVAGAPLEEIAAGAGPDEVIAGTAIGHIVSTTSDDKIIAIIAREVVAAGTADQNIVAVATEQDISAITGVDRIVTSAAIDREPDLTGNERRSVDGVVAIETIDDERIIGALRMIDDHLRGQPPDGDGCAAAGDIDAIVARSPVNDHGIRLAVAIAGARGCQVDSDLPDAGTGEIVDRDGVGAARSRNLDALDAVEVHRNGPDVSKKRRAAATGRDIDTFADIGAVELQRVGARPALDHVAAVARIPDEQVVAVAEQRCVIAATTRNGVIAIAADQQIVAVATEQDVIAAATVDDVVAGAAVDRVRGVRRTNPAACRDRR